MAKKHKVYRKGTEILLPISKHININFRNYALYVLENRGIPSFYDGLTNVQRFILQNTPTQFTKTISVIGACIESGYHHGDKSIAGAINKLARPHGCRNPLLEGSGFFGNAISHEAAAPRYTSVRLNKTISQILKKNSFLNTRDEDGQWQPLWVDLPLGLSTMIVGIAVGYSTTILPRALEDIQKFLNGEITEIYPKFYNFSGKITRFKGMDRSWLIEGVVEINDKERSVRVTELPPLMKYSSFLKKLDKILEKYEGKVSLKNRSRDQVDIIMIFKSRDLQEFKEFAELVNKSTKMIVTETPVFVKDGVVLVYDRIEDYLTDFRYRLADLNMRRAFYFLSETSEELEFNLAKKAYLEFMIAKKRKDEEVNNFLAKYSEKIAKKLESISLRKLTQEEIQRTFLRIRELEIEKKQLENQYHKLQIEFENLSDPTIQRGTVNQQLSSFELFNDTDFEEYDGIQIFKVENDEDEEENQEDQV